MVMEELYYVYGTAAVIAVYFLRPGDLAAGSTRSRRSGCSSSVTFRSISFRRSATTIGRSASRGNELVGAANLRAFWALLWLLLVYHSNLGKKLAGAPAGSAAQLVGRRQSRSSRRHSSYGASSARASSSRADLKTAARRCQPRNRCFARSPS